MTFILNSRNIIGVVLIADKIVTNQTDELNFYFAENLISVLDNIMIGSSDGKNNAVAVEVTDTKYLNRLTIFRKGNFVKLPQSSESERVCNLGSG